MKEATECEIGYWNNITDQAACFICPAGKICPQKGTKLPSPCPVGFVCLEGNAFPCPIGYFCEMGTKYNINDTICTDMSLYITSANNIHNCPINCAVGYFCPV